MMEINLQILDERYFTRINVHTKLESANKRLRWVNIFHCSHLPTMLHAAQGDCGLACDYSIVSISILFPSDKLTYCRCVARNSGC